MFSLFHKITGQLVKFTSSEEEYIEQAFIWSAVCSKQSIIFHYWNQFKNIIADLSKKALFLLGQIYYRSKHLCMPPVDILQLLPL